MLKQIAFMLTQDEEEGEGESETPAPAEEEEEGEIQQSSDVQEATVNDTAAEADAAAGTALPSDDDGFGDEEEEEEVQQSSDLQEATVIPTSAEADTALPSDDDADFDEFAEEAHGETEVIKPQRLLCGQLLLIFLPLLSQLSCLLFCSCNDTTPSKTAFNSFSFQSKTMSNAHGNTGPFQLL